MIFAKNSIPMIHLLLIAPLLLATADFASASAYAVQEPRKVDYDSLVSDGHSALEKEQWSDALHLSTLAIGVQPDRHEAFVIACLALHSTGRHQLALQALGNAIQRAPEDKRAFLQEVEAEIQAATNELAFEKHLKAGIEALEQNQAAKAARELTAAWLIKPERTELAVEAVTAWIAVQEYGPARALLLNVAKAPSSEATANQVRDLLALVDPLVAHNYSTNLATAADHVLHQRLRTAQQLLEETTELMPERFEAHLELARLSVVQGLPDSAVFHLREAIGHGALQKELILSDKGLRTLSEHPGFQKLVLNTFGAKALSQLSQPVAIPEGEEPEVTNTIGMRFLRVPAGRFTMGSPASEANRNVPAEVQTQVVLSKAYYLGATEVTQKQWIEVMETNPSVHRGDQLPVQRITWLQASEFCQRLSEREGVLYRLPTEAEWEFACRAGSTSAYGHGDKDTDLKQFAWFKGSFSEVGAPQPVATLKPNPWGFSDMSGNVYEWVFDYYAAHMGVPLNDPLGPEEGTLRVVRGGAYTSESSACRSAHRARYASDFRSPDVGFRVIREVP
ncbi:MAG: sulfatase activating formylglycine-generating enzyme [Planctomycetota bacterium]|jgi:formylglycine-generating enzyme required for sulfatase activity